MPQLEVYTFGHNYTQMYIQCNTQVISHIHFKSHTWLFSNIDKCSGHISEVVGLLFE